MNLERNLISCGAAATNDDRELIAYFEIYLQELILQDRHLIGFATF
jgi:hypothetical protein